MGSTASSFMTTVAPPIAQISSPANVISPLMIASAGKSLFWYSCCDSTSSFSVMAPEQEVALKSPLLA